MYLTPTFWFTPLQSSEAFASSSEGKEIVVVKGARERTLDEDAETLLEDLCRIGKGLLGEPAWISPKALTYNAKILFSQLSGPVDEECLMLRLCRAVASWYQNEVRLGRTQLEALYRPDYTFYVGANHFPMRAHRSVLGNYSFWKARFESGMKDAGLNVQIVPDAEPRIFSLLLNYLYGSPLNPGRLSLKKLEQLLFLADYFCLVRLEKGLEVWIKYLKEKKFFQKVEELLEEHPLHRPMAGVIANLPREHAPKSLTDRTIWTVRGEEGPCYDVKGANKAALIARTEQLGRGETDDFGVTPEFMQAWLDFVHHSVGSDPYFERLYERTREEVLHAYPLMQREGLFFERAEELDRLWCEKAAGSALPKRVPLLERLTLDGRSLKLPPERRRFVRELTLRGDQDLAVISQFPALHTLSLIDMPSFGSEELNALPENVRHLTLKNTGVRDVTLSQIKHVTLLKIDEEAFKCLPESVDEEAMRKFLTVISRDSRLHTLDLSNGELGEHLVFSRMPCSFKLLWGSTKIICSVGG